jgi:hypothetical protein
MVGLAVGATGESSKDDRQDAGPTQDARRYQILFLFAITFENPYSIDAERIQFLIIHGPPSLLSILVIFWPGFRTAQSNFQRTCRIVIMFHYRDS